jgi:hypothetical protein
LISSHFYFGPRRPGKDQVMFKRSFIAAVAAVGFFVATAQAAVVVTFESLGSGSAHGKFIHIPELGVDMHIVGDGFIDGGTRLQLEGDDGANSFVFRLAGTSTPAFVELVSLHVGAERGGAVNVGFVDGEISGLAGATPQWNWAGRLSGFTDVLASESTTGNTGAAISSISFQQTGGNIFDVQSVTIVPEPAALGLLGVAGLMMLRRRRA